MGRERELAQAREVLRGEASIDFHGQPGIGKSSLIRWLAHEGDERWRDGVVYARVAGQPLEDVLQWLFEVFWSTEPRWAPGPWG